MGSELTLRHFSHDHLLKISPYQETSSRIKCSACKLDAPGWICTCKKCKYLIHFQCSQIPQKIQLPFHKEHILYLLSESDTFTCSACNKQGDGFSYSCRECEIYIHILCATMPPIVAHESHDHLLKLKFDGTNSFRCDICKGSGGNHWLYWCRECDFYAHLNCATPKPTFAFSSSSNGTDKFSNEKENPKFNPKSSFTGSNSSTSSSMASTEKNDDEGNKTKSYESSGADAHLWAPTTKPTIVDKKTKSYTSSGVDAYLGNRTIKPTIVASTLSTGTGKTSNKKGSANSNTPEDDSDDDDDYAAAAAADDDDGNKTKSYEQEPAGRFDVHSSGPTPKQTVPDSKAATEKDEISKNKGNANSNVTKANSYGTEHDQTKRYGPGKGGFNANSGDKTPKQTFTVVNPTTGTGKTTKSSATPIKGKNFNPKFNYDDSDTDSDGSNDEVIDYRSVRKHKNVKSDEDENND